MPAAACAPLATAAGQITAAAVIMVPVALILDRPWTLPMPGWPVLGALLGLAALATCLAYIIYYRILATAGAVNLMLVTFLIPVSAILLGTAHPRRASCRPTTSSAWRRSASASR